MTHLQRVLALCLAVSLLPGCMLSQLVDRTFLGVTVRKPAVPDRIATGVFLIPITFAVDAITLPIQALLLVILGDHFPFPKPTSVTAAVASNETFQRLDEATRRRAVAELEDLLRSGELAPGASLVLDTDGHWSQVALDTEARSQLIARSQRTSPELAVCRR